MIVFSFNNTGDLIYAKNIFSCESNAKFQSVLSLCVAAAYDRQDGHS